MDLAVIGAVAALYFVSAKLGLQLAFVHASATPVWAPTGIALALLLLVGYRVWPGIFLGAFWANITTAGSILTCLGIATGNTLEGMVGAYLVNRFAKGRHALEQVQDLFKFVFFAALLSTMVSATLGVASLLLTGFGSGANYGTIWWTWWLGDVTGDLVVAPFLLLWIAAPLVRWNWIQALEAFTAFSSLIFVGLAVFGGLFGIEDKNYPIDFLCIPLLVWIALRFGPRGTSLAVFLLSGIAIWGTLRGFGPFVTASKNESLLLLQAFMGVISITKLTLANVVAERNQSRRALQEAHDLLETKVQERTAQLIKTAEELRAEISERKQTEEILRRNEERTRLIIETANDAFIEIDEKGLITDWNQQAEKIFGWPRSEVIGRSMMEKIMPRQYHEKHSQGFHRFFTTGEGPILFKPVEITALHRDGHEFPVELTVWPTRRENTYHFNAFIRDISERRQSEKTLLEKLREIARIDSDREQLELFAFAASHDLQEPLQKIISFADLLKIQRGSVLGKKGRECLDKIQETALRMGELIHDLLHFTRVGTQAPSFEPVNLKTEIERVLSDLELKIQASHARVELRDLPTLNVDRPQIREVFQNLISNALKFHKENEAPVITIQSRNLENRFAEITVEDNGIGFDEKQAERIFRPFTRLRHRSEFSGSGIGLAICQKIVKRHGGTITAKSAPDKGSTFTITLPFSIKTEEAKK